MGRRLLLPVILAASLGSAATRADGQPDGVPPGNVIIELRKQILNGGGTPAEKAASELFLMANEEQNRFLLETLEDPAEGSRETRLAILRALHANGRHRPNDACNM